MRINLPTFIRNNVLQSFDVAGITGAKLASVQQATALITVDDIIYKKVGFAIEYLYRVSTLSGGNVCNLKGIALQYGGQKNIKVQPTAL